MVLMLKFCTKIQHQRMVLMLKFCTKIGSQTLSYEGLDRILQDARSFKIKNEDMPLFIYKYALKEKNWELKLKEKKWELKLKEKNWELKLKEKNWELKLKEKNWELKLKEKDWELKLKEKEKDWELREKDCKWEKKLESNLNNIKWKFSYATQRHVYETFLLAFWYEICQKMPNLTTMIISLIMVNYS